MGDNIKMKLRKIDCEDGIDATGPGSCAVAGFGIISVEHCVLLPDYWF